MCLTFRTIIVATTRTHRPPKAGSQGGSDDDPQEYADVHKFKDLIVMLGDIRHTLQNLRLSKRS